jgi:hypothetical protein
MESQLKEKLWKYIVHNNPDLMFDLQEDYSVSSYLDGKISGILPMLSQLLEQGLPSSTVEERCMETLTEELKPSRFLYIKSVLEDEFEDQYYTWREAGIVTYETVNLIAHCKEVFEHFGFTPENEEDPDLRNAVIGQVAGYLT